MNLAAEIAALRTRSVPELTARFVELFGQPPRRRHPDYLRKRIAFRLQANAFGGLPGPARAALDRLIAELQMPAAAPPHREATALAVPDRLRPGTVLQREWRGRPIRVEVLPDGFIYDNEKFDSLSAVAKRVTGQHWSGPRFFNLTERKRA